jgi:hypothetical protein
LEPPDAPEAKVAGSDATRAARALRRHRHPLSARSRETAPSPADAEGSRRRRSPRAEATRTGLETSSSGSSPTTLHDGSAVATHLLERDLSVPRFPCCNSTLGRDRRYYEPQRARAPPPCLRGVRPGRPHSRRAARRSPHTNRRRTGFEIGAGEISFFGLQPRLSNDDSNLGAIEECATEVTGGRPARTLRAWRPAPGFTGRRRAECLWVRSGASA